MKKYYCECIDNRLVLYTKDDKNLKRLISTDAKDIIKGIKYIASLKTYVRIEEDNIELFSYDESVSITIVDYDKVLVDENHYGIEEAIKSAYKNGYVRKNSSLSLNKPKRNHNNYTVVKAASLILSAVMMFTATSPRQTRKSNVKYEEEPSYITEMHPKETNVKSIADYSDEELLDMVLNSESIGNAKEQGELQTEKVDQIIEEKQAEPEEKNTVTEREFLMEYFNVDDISKADDFLSEFIPTMLEYGKTYTLDDMADIFFEVANMPLDSKIQQVKMAFDLDDEKLDAIAATLVAEGVGWGNKYIDVYAATTTALNHLQFPIWVNSISNVRGTELGHNIYGHTCYTSQFNAYMSNNYYTFLGNRDLTGFRAVVDALYINYTYGIVLHNYCQFRGAWIDMPNAKIYESGGNKYIDALKAKDRVMYMEEKNNSL